MLAYETSKKVYTNYTTASGISTDANVFVQQVNAQGLCGATDWRLPKAHELQSLLNYSVAYPTPMIDSVFLPNSLGTQYWSSSPNTDNADYAWFVNFSDGRVSNSDRFRQYAVRLVRGTPYVPATRFTASSDGQEVTDNKTRLIWRRCSEGLTWNGATCTGTLQFYNYESALTRAVTEASASSKAWRLPNIKELASISDIARNPDPAIDLAVFPGTPSERYWASTPFFNKSRIRLVWRFLRWLPELFVTHKQLCCSIS
ncbi:DUF1566 domain-containing protein [Methylocucumis oryzae]|uniref:Lcl C-terminal domain-containing protein n=1 Tax=Methylocucumis oryzae TaxID=1632867 RepID=A0A0F3IEA9_9GAMM|nr:DUF1566 domain-containing protein [Methylocucumis oryzae]KJV05076.1 hypothetical protein VZ94_20820 [Methylocucumis oryzae]